MRSLPESLCPLSWAGASVRAEPMGSCPDPGLGGGPPGSSPSVAEAKCTGECPPSQISCAHAPEDTKSTNWQRVGPGQGTPSAPVQLALILP